MHVTHNYSKWLNAGIGNTDTLHPNSCFCSFSIPTSRIKFLLLVIIISNENSVRIVVYVQVGMEETQNGVACTTRTGVTVIWGPPVPKTLAIWGWGDPHIAQGYRDPRPLVKWGPPPSDIDLQQHGMHDDQWQECHCSFAALIVHDRMSSHYSRLCNRLHAS